MFYFRLLCNRLGEQKKMSFLTNVKEYDIKANIKHFVTIILNALLPLLNSIREAKEGGELYLGLIIPKNI